MSRPPPVYVQTFRPRPLWRIAGLMSLQFLACVAFVVLVIVAAACIPPGA